MGARPLTPLTTVFRAVISVQKNRNSEKVGEVVPYEKLYSLSLVTLSDLVDNCIAGSVAIWVLLLWPFRFVSGFFAILS